MCSLLLENPYIFPKGVCTFWVVRKHCIVTGKVSTIHLKVFVFPVLLGRTDRFVYKLPIHLLLRFWRISDVFHASVISDFFSRACWNLSPLNGSWVVAWLFSDLDFLRCSREYFYSATSHSSYSMKAKKYCGNEQFSVCERQPIES